MCIYKYSWPKNEIMFPINRSLNPMKNHHEKSPYSASNPIKKKIVKTVLDFTTKSPQKKSKGEIPQFSKREIPMGITMERSLLNPIGITIFHREIP